MKFPSERSIRIATRTSQLALWQAEYIADKLRAIDNRLVVELVPISTQGDRDTVAPLWQMGGLGVFTGEVQKAVLDHNADLAVHSLKDLPTETTSGLLLAAVPERAIHYDVLVLPANSQLIVDSANPFKVINPHAVIGTGSLRRRAQINHVRPDISFVDVRGNVDTRLRKLDHGECEALILAAAGLTRLSLSHRISINLTPPWMYPAVGQGALGIECRVDDEPLIKLLGELNHTPTRIAVNAERTLLSALRAGCHAPVGVKTILEQDSLILEAVILDQSGNSCIKSRISGEAKEPEQLAHELVEKLYTLGARALLS